MGLKIQGVDPQNSFVDLMNTLRAVYKESHGFKAVVIDSLDAMEPMVFQETCIRNNWKSIEAPGFGKGYVAAADTWRLFVHACNALRRDRGILVLWLALAEAVIHEEPGVPPFRKYGLRLQKRSESLLTQSADAVLFLNTKATIKEIDSGFNQKTYIADGGGTRWLYTDSRPAFMAKNRFNMPEAIMVDKANPWVAISPYLPAIVLPTTVKKPLAIPDDPPLITNPASTQAEMSKALDGDTIPI
jgi:hypothetical protein